MYIYIFIYVHTCAVWVTNQRLAFVNNSTPSLPVNTQILLKTERLSGVMFIWGHVYLGSCLSGGHVYLCLFQLKVKNLNVMSELKSMSQV